MKINAINLNFGKKLVATCFIKNNANEKHNASIYEYDVKNKDDFNEIQNSLYTNSIKHNFYKESLFYNNQLSKYYALLDNTTNEIVACTKMTSHYNKNQGYYTLIDEIEANENYIDPLTILIGYIANKARKMQSNTIQTAFSINEADEFKHQKFKKTAKNNWSLHSRGFDEAILRAEKRNNLEIL